ncbi:MAG: ATP-binding protein [Burkholderiales bacterium]|nr:ATP-binding protein [Burkholderiales bacterium]
MAQHAQSEAVAAMPAPSGNTGQSSVDKASSTDNPEVLAERCDYLYRRIGPAVVATLALSLLLDAFLWRTRPIPLLMFWQATVLVLGVGFWSLAWAYRRAKAKGTIDPEVWVRRAAIGALALGTGWGYAAAVFFPGGEQEQIFIAFVVALVATGGLPMFSTVWWVYALYALGVMIPFNVVLFAYGTENFRVLGAAVPTLYVANVFTAYQLGRVFAAAYGLRGAYRKLWDDNAEINAQLASQLDDLLEAHRAVQAYDRKLSLFSERAPIAVFEVDPNATIHDMNPAAENLFGYAAHELVGRNGITMLFPSDDRPQTEKWWREFVAAGKPTTIVAERCLRRDELELTCEWTLTPLVDEDDKVTSIVIQGRDITHQRESERMRSEFTSTLSHELRTPLTSILGSLQLLRSGVLGELDKDQDEVTEIAERNGQRLLDLINEVLDIEKIESGRVVLVPETVEVDEFVTDSVRLNQGFADRFTVTLKLVGEPPRVRVRGDRKRLMQIMTNLLSNAAKFSPPNETVEVTCTLKDGRVRLVVADRGPGIPEAFRSKIFGRFAQADSTDSRIKGGTGLGLAICKRLIEMMQGRIGFSPREGGGTEFWFELPVMRAEEEDTGGAQRILVTENDTVAAEYLAMVLGKAGYSVDMAPDASTSRALLGRWQYAMWMVDRNLRDVEDTVGLIAELHHRLVDTKIVMLMSLRSEQTTIEEPGKHGIIGWLMKNEPRQRVLEVVEGAIGPAPARAEAEA